MNAEIGDSACLPYAPALSNDDVLPVGGYHIQEATAVEVNPPHERLACN
jgi:hypothetical protein